MIRVLFLFALAAGISLTAVTFARAQDAPPLSSPPSSTADESVPAAAPNPTPAPPTTPAATKHVAPPTPAPVDLPVLTTPKNVNEVIDANDLIIQSFPAQRVSGGDIIHDSSQIIGLAARRPLQAGQPIRLIDLKKEELVQRGSDVSLTFRNGSLEITAMGKALENGSLGDVIKITNVGTNRTVDAKITGPNQAQVVE